MRQILAMTLMLLLTTVPVVLDASNHIKHHGLKTLQWKTIFSTDQVKLANCRNSENQVGFHLAINTADETHFTFYCGPGQVGKTFTTEVEEGI